MSEDDMITMALAAEDAEADLHSLYAGQNGCSSVTIFDVANWWKRWYMKAGHKRLGRIIIKYASKEE